MGGHTMSGDPKATGHMLQIRMRGEMRKAVGEMLLKYGTLLEEGK